MLCFRGYVLTVGVRHAFATGWPIFPGSALCYQVLHCAGCLAQALTVLATEGQGGDAGFITPRDRMVSQVRRHFHRRLAPHRYQSQVPIRLTLNFLNKVQAPNHLLIMSRPSEFSYDNVPKQMTAKQRQIVKLLEWWKLVLLPHRCNTGTSLSPLLLCRDSPSFNKVTDLLYSPCRAHTAKTEKVTHRLRFNPL
jgi:hypothetical protein